MVLLFMLMIALCLAEMLSDTVAGVVRRLAKPRAPIVRARRYRFN